MFCFLRHKKYFTATAYQYVEACLAETLNAYVKFARLSKKNLTKTRLDKKYTP